MTHVLLVYPSSFINLTQLFILLISVSLLLFHIFIFLTDMIIYDMNFFTRYIHLFSAVLVFSPHILCRFITFAFLLIIFPLTRLNFLHFLSFTHTFLLLLQLARHYNFCNCIFAPFHNIPMLPFILMWITIGQYRTRHAIRITTQRSILCHFHNHEHQFCNMLVMHLFQDMTSNKIIILINICISN